MKQHTHSFSLRRNFSLILSGNLLYTLSQWGILMILAKLGSPRMVGQFTLGLAITAPIILLTDLQLRSVLATDAEREVPYRDYVTLKRWMCAAACLLLILCAFIGGYPPYTAGIILMIGLSKMIESFCELNYGLFQREDKMNLIARSLISRGILSFTAIALLVWLKGNLLMAVAGLAASWLIVLLILDLKAARKFEKSAVVQNFTHMKKLFLKSLPLGFVMMMLSLNINIPRYILEKVVGTTSLGYFSAISYILMSGNLLVTALGQASSSRLAVYYSRGRYQEFAKLVQFLLMAGAAIGLAGLFIALTLGKLLLSVIYSQAYAEYQYLFSLLMFSAIFLYAGSFLGFALTAARKFTIQPVLASAWSAATFIASMLLIPKFGLNGAAYAGIVSAVFQFVTTGIVVFFEMKRMKQTAEARSYHSYDLGG